MAAPGLVSISFQALRIASFVVAAEAFGGVTSADSAYYETVLSTSLAPAAADHLASRSRRACSIFVSAAAAVPANVNESRAMQPHRNNDFVFIASIEPGIERSVNVFPTL